jgi:ribosomal protein S18 acetylase RimI-like enzyme
MAKLILDNQLEVLATIYDAMLLEPTEFALARTHRVTFASFVQRYLGPDIVGLEMDGKIAGGMIFENGHVHLAMLPWARGRWTRYLREMLEIGFEKYGPKLSAFVNSNNVRAQRFVESVGCRKKLSKAKEYLVYAVEKEGMRYGIGSRTNLRRD